MQGKRNHQFAHWLGWGLRFHNERLDTKKNSKDRAYWNPGELREESRSPIGDSPITYRWISYENWCLHFDGTSPVVYRAVLHRPTYIAVLWPNTSKGLAHSLKKCEQLIVGCQLTDLQSPAPLCHHLILIKAWQKAVSNAAVCVRVRVTIRETSSSR